jgi:CAAX protease family protein
VNVRESHSTRLALWLALVALLTFVQIYGRYVADEAELNDPLYSSSFAAASAFQWVLLGAIALALAAGSWSLFALRRPRRVGRATLVAVGTFLLVAAIGALLSQLSLDPAREQGLVPEEWPPPNAAVFAINVALVVIAGPFVEEMLFRGLGFSLLRPYGRTVAVVGSAAAFAAVHGLLEGFVLVFVLGMGLAVMRELTDSTIPGFVLHATFNAIAIAGAAASAAGG